jgi:uncharacterized protein YktB (UPF0637 family)
MAIKSAVVIPAPTAQAFEVFGVNGLESRMAAIREEVRPWLERVGETLAPALADRVHSELFAHVARHARRTVNPPDDSWVAFGPGKRGYKKDRHFKVAISGSALRFLFEIGPEYADKVAWANAWRGAVRSLRPGLSNTDLAWFRSEHDEEPAGPLTALGIADLAGLAERLLDRRDGQLVLGRRLTRNEALQLEDCAFADRALETFSALAPCYLLAG